MVDLFIRSACESDSIRLRDIYKQASLTNNADREVLLANPDALVYLPPPEGRTRVAVAEDEVVGFATLLAVEDVGELEDLFVAPDWMRRGVGRALVLDAVAEARGSGLSRIEVSANPNALGFYERLGFVPEGLAETRFGPVPRMHVDVATHAR